MDGDEWPYLARGNRTIVKPRTTFSKRAGPRRWRLRLALRGRHGDGRIGAAHPVMPGFAASPRSRRLAPLSIFDSRHKFYTRLPTRIVPGGSRAKGRARPPCRGASNATSVFARMAGSRRSKGTKVSSCAVRISVGIRTCRAVGQRSIVSTIVRTAKVRACGDHLVEIVHAAECREFPSIGKLLGAHRLIAHVARSRVTKWCCKKEICWLASELREQPNRETVRRSLCVGLRGAVLLDFRLYSAPNCWRLKNCGENFGGTVPLINSVMTARMSQAQT